MLDETGIRVWAARYVGWATSENACHRDEIVDGPRHGEEFADAGYHTPVVVSIGNGGPIIWDGWHRIACAIARGDRRIMAIVGIQQADRIGTRATAA